MIESDINERMARFAPSQTTIGEMRGPTVAEARRLTEQSIAPADPALDMIRAQRGLPSMQDTMRMRLAGEEPEQLTAAPVEDPALEMIRQARRDRISATFYGASMVNPDEAGKAQRLADQVGMGSELVRRHMPEFERQAQMADFQRRNLPQKDPVLAQFLADKQFAEIAHDDVGTLEKFAPLMVDAWMLYTTGSTLDMRKGAARAKMMKDESWIGTKAMIGMATPADLEQAERLNRKAQGIGDVGFLGTLAEQIELNLRMAPDVLTAGVAGAAAGTLAGPGIMTAAGFAAGTGAGIIATTAQMESGLAYLQMRRDGVSEEEAVRAAVGVGLVNGVIELVGMKVAAAPFKKVAKRLMAETTAQAITRPTTRKALATAITEWGKQAGAEGLEEAAQEISLIAGERMAKALDGIDPERALEEEIPRIFESFVTGVQVGAVLGSAGPAVNLAVDLKNVNAAERQQEMFTRLATLSTDNKVRERNPVFFERFMAAQATDAGIPDMYVNAAEMRNVLAQSGLTKEQVDEILPGVRESLAQASELRDDVVIPTARFASRLAGTPLGDALIPHLRGRPNVASIAEMQRAQQMKPQMVAEIEQAAESIDAVRQTEDQQLRAIETTRLEQLRAAGQNEQVAKAGARVYRSFVQSMAAQLKITPEQFEMTRRLRGIQRGEGAAPAAAPLEQANRDIIASVDAELGGIMDAAKEASRAAGKTRSKDTQAAAFKAKQAWISANPARYEEYQVAQRMEALENERVREAAASALAGKIDESLATAAKILTDTGFVLDYESPAPSKSKYYRKGNTLIRLSDHEIPVTQERAAAREAGVQVPYRDFVFDGTNVDAELLQELEMIAKRAAPGVMEQAAAGPRRGWFDPVRLVIALTENSDWSTFWHELNHYFLTTYVAIANDGNAPQSVLNDLDILLRWFNMEGDTPEARLASWNALTPEQQAPHFEALAYNSEIYGFEGKAPSLELRSVFAKIASFIRRVYSDVKTDLNNIYRREFGKDLPIMTGEVREVMDRMLATEEQIKTYQAIQSMVPAFQTQQESKMPDAEWAAYQAMNAEAEEAAVMELQKASLRQMAWLEPARSRIIKEMQAEHKERRAEVRKEAEQEVSRRRVYRAMSYLRRGQLIDAEGVEKETSGAHKLDIDMVRQMYELRQMVEKYREPETVTPDMPEMAQSGMEPTRPDWKKLGTGKYGMLASEGLSPDMVAEMFGYANGDAMIRDLVDAKPVKEAVEDRTSELMQARYGDETTPEARERRIQEALHNEARFRFIAVEYRHMSGATEPVRVMMEAARLAAEDIMARKRIKDIRPSQHEAAEARAARDAMNAQRVGGNPAAAAQAAYTRAKNEVLNAPREDTPAALFAATAAAEIAGEAARAESLQRSADRIAEFTERYGNVEPDLLKIRAKRAQLYQNQLAREALKAKAEVAKALKGFRKFFKADSKIAETRELSLVMAARSILAEHGIGRSDLRPTAYLDKLQAYNPAVYEAIAPIVAKATRQAGDYRDMRLEDFRAMAEAVEALWVQAKRERGIQVGEDRVAVEAVVAALDRRLEAIGIPEVVAGERAAPTTADRAKRFLMQLRATSRRVEAWTDAMDGSDPERPYTRYLWRPVKDAVEAFRVARNKYVKKFVELLTALDLPVGTIDAPELNYTFGKGNGGIGKAELLGAMLHTGNQSNYRKLLLGRGWATLDENGNLDDSRWQAFVTRMQQQGTLTKSDYDFLQSSWDLLEDIKPLLQKAHYDLMGFYFKEIEATEVVTPFGTYRGGYVPAATDKFLVADAVTREGMAELESDWRQALPSTGMGMTKQRIETYTRPLVLDVRMVATHMDAALRFAMIQPAVKDALKILNDRGFSARLERLDPTAKNEMLIPWLHRAARQLVSEPGRFKAVDAFWRGVRTRTGMSIMFANLRNAMQQVTGLFPAALKVKPIYLKSALAAYTTSPRQTANMVAALSPFMAERMRGETFELQETMNDILLNPSKFEQVQKWSTKHGYFMQQAFQNNVDIVAWLGAYNQFLAEDAAGMSEDRAQKEAIAAGNSAVRLTQGSVLPEDISAFEAGTPFYRTLTQFSGYFNSLANVNGTEYVKVVRDMGWRGGKGKLLYMYMIGFAAPAIVSDAIVRSLGDGWDDEDEDGYLDVAMDFFFGSQFRAAAAVVPFGSTAFTLVTTAFNNKPYDDRMTSSPSVSAIEASTVGVGKAIVNVVDEDKELTGKNVRDVLTALSLATGIPISAAGRPVGYLVDVQRGKVEPEGPVDLIRGLVTGTATQESKR